MCVQAGCEGCEGGGGGGGCEEKEREDEDRAREDGEEWRAMREEEARSRCEREEEEEGEGREEEKEGRLRLRLRWGVLDRAREVALRGCEERIEWWAPAARMAFLWRRTSLAELETTPSPPAWREREGEGEAASSARRSWRCCSLRRMRPTFRLARIRSFSRLDGGGGAVDTVKSESESDDAWVGEGLEGEGLEGVVCLWRRLSLPFIVVSSDGERRCGLCSSLSQSPLCSLTLDSGHSCLLMLKMKMKMMMLMVTMMVMMAAATTPPPPLPTLTYPSSYSANVTETTYTPLSTHSVEVAYDWETTSLLIARPDGSVNPICADVKPGSSAPCTHLAHDTETRFLLFPASRECCTLCTHQCGTEKPSWVHAVPSVYAGVVAVQGEVCNMWALSSNTPDRVATAADGRLCSLYDGGADYPGDGAWNWDIPANQYSPTVDPSVFDIPSWCSPSALSQSCRDL